MRALVFAFFLCVNIARMPSALLLLLLLYIRNGSEVNGQTQANRRMTPGAAAAVGSASEWVWMDGWVGGWVGGRRRRRVV